MKFLSIGFIILAILSCKPTKIDPNQITGKYKHGYAYQLNDYGLADHDSIFIDLKADQTFEYDRYFFVPGVVSREQSSYGKWQLKENKIILNSDDKKLNLRFDTLSYLPKNQSTKLHFLFDFKYFNTLERYNSLVHNDLNKSFNFFLCENSKKCHNLSEKSIHKTKLSVKDTLRNTLTYEKWIPLDILKKNQEYYFEVKINKKNLKKYSSPIHRKSIRSESFKISDIGRVDEISMYLQQLKYIFHHEIDLDFYPLINIKIHVNKNNELKLKNRKLFKAKSMMKYYKDWESLDEYKKSLGW